MDPKILEEYSLLLNHIVNRLSYYRTENDRSEAEVIAARIKLVAVCRHLDTAYAWDMADCESSE